MWFRPSTGDWERESGTSLQAARHSLYSQIGPSQFGSGENQILQQFTELELGGAPTFARKP
jgi:hypothetical protein